MADIALHRIRKGELELSVHREIRSGRFADDRLEEVQVVGAHGRPEHLLAVEAASAFESELDLRMIEQIADCLRDAALRPETDENAAIVVQKEASIQIGRGDDGGAGGEGVGERAAGDLLGIEVGRDVDIGGGEITDYLGLADIAIDEAHRVMKSMIVHELKQLFPVAFLLHPLYARMSLADDEIAGIGMAREDMRQSADRILEALASGHQPESGDHLAAREPEARLGLLLAFQGGWQGAVVDECYLASVDVVVAIQRQFGAESTLGDWTIIGLRRRKAAEGSRINSRVKKMIEQGLVDEVKSLLAEEKALSPQACCAIGYAEIIDYLNGEMSLEDATELIKKNTRRLAKNQRTWFKTFNNVNWLDIELEEPDEKIFERTKALLRIS